MGIYVFLKKNGQYYFTLWEIILFIYKRQCMKTLELFIKQAKIIHGDKYDYSKCEYNGAHIKVCIICPIHGEFWQTPANHLKGRKCPKCKFDKLKKTNLKTLEQFIEEAKQVHGDKYDYSKVVYVNDKTKICITCPKHGEFWQTPNNHIKNHGCPKCSFEKNKDVNRGNLLSFIENAYEIQGDKYDYSKVKYVNNKTKVCIICPKHGEFWQTPHSHLTGAGCPNCQQSRLENKTKIILEKHNIKNIQRCDKTYLPWLDKQHLDFYLPDCGVAIECQGIQHYKEIDYFGGKEKFELTKKLDEIKRNKVKEHNIELVYINYNFTNEKIEKIINDISKKNG